MGMKVQNVGIEMNNKSMKPNNKFQNRNDESMTADYRPMRAFCKHNMKKKKYYIIFVNT